MSLMKCQKCGIEFPEKEIQDSHDIPKYMGGEDKDGRHWLCEKCHKEYEYEVLKVSLMNYIKTLPENEKVLFRKSAKLVQKYFFKNIEDDNGNFKDTQTNP